MSIAGSARRLLGSLVAASRQRLELAALDLEEELLRAGLAVAAIMAATLLATLALAALAAAVVVALWGWSPVGALLLVALAFAAAAGYVGLRLARSWQAKPAFMAATLDELGRDAEVLRKDPA